MSKKGRIANRQRRRDAATPGAGWAAVKAAEQMVGHRDEIAARYPGNPVLTLLAARNHQVAIADTMLLRGHGDLRPEDPRMFDAFGDCYVEVTGQRPDTVPALPVGAKAAVFDLMDMTGQVMPDPHLRVGHMRNTESAATLHAAQMYVISPGMHAACMAAAETLDGDDLMNFAEADVEAAAGALYLPYTQHIRTSDASARGLRMLTWRVRNKEVPHVGTVRALQVEGWTDNPRTEDRQLAEDLGHPLPRLLRSATMWLVLDAGSTKEEVGWSSRSTPRLGGEPNAEDDAAAEVVGQFSGETASDPAGNIEIRYLYAFMRLASQQISTEGSPKTQHDNGRPTSPDALKVRVVQLRSASTTPSDRAGDPSAPRRYRHRYVVRMHKVNQWYPSEGRHKVIWRGPYIKGPEGAPLLAGETVQALVR